MNQLHKIKESQKDEAWGWVMPNMRINIQLTLLMTEFGSMSSLEETFQMLPSLRYWCHASDLEQLEVIDALLQLYCNSFCATMGLKDFLALFHRNDLTFLRIVLQMPFAFLSLLFMEQIRNAIFCNVSVFNHLFISRFKKTVPPSTLQGLFIGDAIHFWRDSRITFFHFFPAL